MYMYNFISIIILLVTMNYCSIANNSNESSNNKSENEEIPCQLIKKSGHTYYNNKAADEHKLQNVLNKTKNINDIHERVIAITQEFIGTPYIGGTLNVPREEQLYVNTTGVDCTTFTEMVMALALAGEEENADIESFLEKLQSIRYRNGKIAGYPSRLHYISEWAIDNSKRGNFREITNECVESVESKKTIDFMTKNRDLYPALKDNEVYEKIKEAEMPLRNLEYSIIPTSQVNKAAKSCLMSGDAVAIVTNKEGLDVSHIGFINIKNGIPYLIHASSKYKKVINDTTPLKEYLQKQGSPGIRVFRMS